MNKWRAVILIEAEIMAPTEQDAKDYMTVSVNTTIDLGTKVKKISVSAKSLGPVSTLYTPDGVRLG